MRRPGRVKDVRFAVVGRRGSEEEEEGVDGEEDLAEHGDDGDAVYLGGLCW